MNIDDILAILSGKEKERVFVIAEIGKNFIRTKEDESVDKYIANAKELILEAKNAGADAVKFQTHNVEDEQAKIASIVSPHFLETDRYNWVIRNTLSTPIKFWKEIIDYCKKIGIIFFSTPMSLGAAKILNELNVPIWKVGSADILDFLMIDYLASTKKPIIVSSGMSTIEEVDLVMDFMKKRNAQIILMHCVSLYPCPPEKLNLGTIKFFKERYGVPVGFSDHSLGHESAIAAAKLGAAVIEKHFSLKRDHYGADHKVSMLPKEFYEMTRAIREKTNIKINNYGTEIKLLQDEEKNFRPIFRKSLVYSRDVVKGDVIKQDLLYSMRPAGYIKGLASEMYEAALGKTVKVSRKKFDPVIFDDLV